MHDSGTRQKFDTGAQRDTAADKPRPGLISPFFLNRLGEHLRRGALKYSDRNWEKGIPVSRCYESAFRHMLQFAEGRTDEDHLAAVAFNIMAICHFQEMIRRSKLPTHLNDMPDYRNSSLSLEEWLKKALTNEVDNHSWDVLHTPQPKPHTNDDWLKRTIYIAGPMRGKPRFNSDAFFTAEAELRAQGWTVDNPARHDLEEGLNFNDYPTGNEPLPDGFLRNAFEWNCNAICNSGAIYLLPDYAGSKGACIELELATLLGLTVYSHLTSPSPASAHTKLT